MKKSFIAVMALLGTMTVACSDELVDSYENHAQETVYTIPDTVLNPLEPTDSIAGQDDEVKYPIGFSVTVNDYKEVE